MKNRTFFQKLGDFALGKGFYIVLFLCVAAIGISGYFLVRSFTVTPTTLPAASAGGNATVTIPDGEERVVSPVVTVPASPNVPDVPEAVLPVQPAAPEPASRTEPAAQTQPAAEPEPQRPAAVVYTWPVNGAVMRDFSVETLALDPTLGDWRTHGGLDLAASEGTRVLAMSAGTVSKVYEDGLMGHTVMIDHGNGLTSVYCGLGEEILVEEGGEVETGAVLGRVENTAIAESGMDSHLHLETWLNGERVDPEEYLPQR